MEQSILRAFALGKVDFFGVADLQNVQDTLRDQFERSILGFPYAISLGIALPNTIVNQLPDAQDNTVIKMQCV